ncbi:MAG: penicillin-binding protein activator [Marivibrio sp.]|uniref:penicillin-binding protein activator n=1 Tax=Marivibrio sp. TaxID=2039719 RepID=UPI0032EF0B8B
MAALLAAVALILTLAGCASEPPQQDQTGPPADGLPPHSPGVDPGDPDAAAAAEAADEMFGAQSDFLLPTEEEADLVGGPRDHVIALLAPLSGRHAGAGEALLQGAQMALFDLGNPEAVLLPLDTQGTPDGAAQAAARAVEEEAGLIVGPLLASSVDAVRPIADQAGLNVVAFSNSPDAAGPPVYLAGFTPSAQVARIIDHAIAEGRTRIAVLAPQGAYGDAVVSAAQQVLRAYESGERRPPAAIAGEITAGDAATETAPAVAVDILPGLTATTEAPPAPISLARIAYYDAGAADHSEVIRRFADYQQRARALAQERADLEARDDEASKAALRRLEPLDTLGDPPFDAVLLPALDAQTAKILAAQLAFYDVDEPAVRILGLQPWDGFGDLSREPTLVGARYVSPPDAYRRQFAERFAAVYGRRPSRLASLGYDVTAVAVSLAGVDDRPARFTAEALTNPTGFLGAEGLFRFTPDGLNERGFAVVEITGQGPRVVSPAPERFPEPPSAEWPPSAEEPPSAEDASPAEGAPPTEAQIPAS